VRERVGVHRDRLRVLVLSGDAGLRRSQLVDAVRADGDIDVVDDVSHADAVASLRRHRPDIVALDLTGIGENGEAASLVHEILAVGPMPIVLIVPVAYPRAASMAALVAGAVETMTAPARWDLSAAVALRKRLHGLRRLAPKRRDRFQRAQRPFAGPVRRRTSQGVVGIAASTGGPPALARLLGGLEGLDRPVVIVQHLQSGFVDGFISWMARESALPVELAVDGAALRSGVALIAPPGLQLSVAPGQRLVLREEPLTLHRPSANVLFHSMADHCGAAGIGVILTGMGDDGAAGLLALRQSGGLTIAQDAASSAVYGMPKAAQEIGAAMEVLPLGEISQAVLRAARGAARR
jgi:two-component system chemotaxis response regulator CheB